MLYVSQVSGMGRGVFSDTPLPKGKLVESCEVIVLPYSECVGVLYDYIFSWPGPRQLHNDTRTWSRAAIALGFGSLYNHSGNPNMRWEVRKRSHLCFYALRNIPVGHQLTINYYWSKEKAKVLLD